MQAPYISRDYLVTRNRNFLSYLWVWGALLGAALALFHIPSVVLFLEVYQAEEIPHAFLISGFLGILSTILFTYLQKYIPYARLATGVLCLLAMVVLGIYLGVQSYKAAESIHREIIFWAFVATFPLQNMVMLLFEGLFGRLFDVQQTKQLTDKASIGITFSGILTLYLIPWLHFPTEGLLFLSASALFLSLVVFGFIAFKAQVLSTIQEDIKEIRAKNSFFQLLDQRYILRLAIFILLVGLISLFTEYLFLLTLEVKFAFNTDQVLKQQESNLIQFLATFSAVILTISFLIRTFVYRHVVARYDLRVGLLIQPLILLVFLIASLVIGLVGGINGLENPPEGFVLFFVMIAICKLIKDALGEALEMPVFRLYLLPIDINLRLDIQVKLEGIIWQIAFWLGGVLLILFVTIALNTVQVIILTTGLILTLIYIIILLYQEYKQTLESTLREKQSEKIDPEVFRKQSLAQKILAEIHEIPATQIAIYLNILQVLNPVTYRLAILKLVDAKGEPIQSSLQRYDQNLKKLLRALDSRMMEHYFEADFLKEILQEAPLRIPLEEKIKEITHRLEQKGRHYEQGEAIQATATQLLEQLKSISQELREENRKLALNIDEEVQRIALEQAARLCILEAIPILDVIIHSKYYPMLENRGLIQEVFQKLRGAEFRLERLKYIKQLTLSKRNEERVFGALLSTYADEKFKTDLLHTLFQDDAYPVRYQALVAASTSESPLLYYNLIDRLDDPLYSNAAFAAIVNIGERIFTTLESAFYLTGQKESIQLRIVQIYGRVGTPKAVELLLSKLNYSNQNVGSLALDMLSECGHKMGEDKVRTINAELREVCDILVWNMHVSLMLKKYNTGKLLTEALQTEIKHNYDKIFSLMGLLYNPNSVDLVKTNLYSGNPEKAEFAIELLDVLLSETIKPTLLPLLNTYTSYAEKVKQLRAVVLNEQIEHLSHEQLLVSLIQRDYKWINRWTKACALSELSQLSHFKDNQVYEANIVNPDVIMSEIAYKSLYEADRDHNPKDIHRLVHYNGQTHIQNLNQHLQHSGNGQGHHFFSMKFDIAGFLGTIPEFEAVPGLTLAEMAKITEIEEYSAQTEIATYDQIEEIDYYLVHNGSVLLTSNQIKIQRYEEGGFINHFSFVNQAIPQVSLWAEKPTVVYKIPREKFNALMSFHDEIPLSILRYKRLLGDILLNLHQHQQIKVNNALMLSEISKIAQILRPTEEGHLASFKNKAEMDFFAVHSGQLAIRVNQREVHRVDPPGFVYPPQLNLEADVPIELVAKSAGLFHQIASDPLAELNKHLEKVLFFRKVADFRGVNDLTLLEIAKRTHQQKYREEEQIAFYPQVADIDYLLVVEGKLSLQYHKNEKTEEVILNKHAFLHHFQFMDQDMQDVKLVAHSHCLLYRIEKERFNQLLSFYDQLPLAILKLHFDTSLYEIVRYLRQRAVFKSLNVLKLLEIARCTQVKQYQQGDRIAMYNDVSELDGVIVYSGQVRLMADKRSFVVFQEGAWLDHLDATMAQKTGIKLLAETDCVIYLIRRKYLRRFMEDFQLTQV